MQVVEQQYDDNRNHSAVFVPACTATAEFKRKVMVEQQEGRATMQWDIQQVKMP